jgi:MFS family permease
MFVHGLFSSLFVISGITLVQELTPSEMRGRVVAARATIITSSLAVGSALGGTLLLVLHYWTLWLLIGGLIAVSSLGVWLRPAVRSQR